jgi:hypothetical protein
MDDLKSLMRRFVDEFQSNGDDAIADELLADIFRNHTCGCRELGHVMRPAGIRV